MSNELIREMVEALETCKSTPLNMVGSNDGGRHLSHDHNKTSAALVKARAYLETKGWTKVSDGLPVVLKPEWRVEVWLWRQETKLPTKVAFDQTMCTPDGFPSRFTHWRYAEPTPESPKG